MWKRIKNLWALSAYKPDFDDDGVSRRSTPILKENLPKKSLAKAQFIPHNKRNPAEEIINEQPHA